MKPRSYRMSTKLRSYLTPETHFDDFGSDGLNVNLITEAGLSRVLNKIENNVFSIITAYRGEYNKYQNITRNRNLRNEFNKRKMGVYQLVGHWRECSVDNVDYNDCPDDKLIDVVERSYLVVKPEDIEYGEFEDIIIDLVNKFDQDGAILKNDKGFFIVESSGNKFKIGSKMVLGKISQAYSQYIKKMDVPFVFEGVEVPNTNFGRQIAKEFGIKYPVGDFDDFRNWDSL